MKVEFRDDIATDRWSLGKRWEFQPRNVSRLFFSGKELRKLLGAGNSRKIFGKYKYLNENFRSNLPTRGASQR